MQIRNLQDYKAFGNSAGVSTASAQLTFQVEEDGNVSLPVLGHVPVAGLTRIEAQRKIEKLYRDSSLVNPLIELKIANLKVQAFGEIKTQGNFTLTKEYTSLIDIIGQAGGLTPAADEKHVKIIRHEKTGIRETYIDLSDINILSDPRIFLQADDIIYIAKNKRAVRDDNLQNVTTLIQPSILIFNTALIIYSLFR
ncbi:polysaccharide biosynthesis/export family protein [Mucilaginibacter mali]|uniref:Polysaccharide biosynthesis/export family protein n=1 Tax=Mucilaginibacter mali TaxID=2740462 RepID=A0A7D4Q9Y0_9SPHI|nr:polysaccharide biosynthesis/export family protein [Mucilaginibacter mali]QKJ30425.1 polysaccharide biosynthesis/export family protein [Mucilaginibacter mali]